MSKQPVNAIMRLAAVAGACALLGGCSGAAGTATSPTAVPPTSVAVTTAPTLAPAPTAARAATAAPVPTPAGSATGSQATPAAAAAAASASPTSTAPANTTTPGLQAASTAVGSQDSGVRLVLDSSASQASYHAREQLVGNTLPTAAVGTSPGVSGALVLGADGSIDAGQSMVTVDLTQLKSDESRRDNFVKSDTLHTSQYPTATFVAQAVQDLPTPLPTSGTATFQLLGDLTVHGVTRPVTWQVDAQFTDTSVTGSATTSVNITDFGMTPPRVGPVLSIEDGLNLELDFTANHA